MAAPWLLLLQAAATPAAEPGAALRGVVIDAIRNCGTAAGREILVCAPDRGFAEGQRLPKLTKPKVPDTSAIKVELRGGDGAAPARDGG